VLRVPSAGNRPSGSVLSRLGMTEKRQRDGWRVNIELAAGRYVDHSSAFGIDPSARDGFDRFDSRKPRAVAALPAVYFDRAIWDSSYSLFATDIRSRISQIAQWSFKIQSLPRQPARLAFHGIVHVPPDRDIFLIDDVREKSVNLREDSVYTFTPYSASSEFRVVVGDHDHVASEVQSVSVPDVIALDRNFPNPFNPSTIVPVSVPSEVTFDLTVFDVLGRKVRLLFSGKAGRGKHFFEWDGKDDLGRNVSSGIYLCQVTTSGGFQASQKMMLLK
jgi:hypothetical protein